MAADPSGIPIDRDDAEAAARAGEQETPHGVSFIALRIDVEGAQADALADALLAAGALSVEVSDPDAGTEDETPLFDEPGASTPSGWRSSRLTALFAADADSGRALDEACHAVGIAVPPGERRVVADQDWVRASQAQFAPMHVAEHLWIVPSWHAPPDPAAINVVLDPGLAFGTGSHPTTRFCLRWLARETRRGDTVLDYGCGSGILAIAAALLGAARVTGIDIDAQALQAARANAERNRVAIEFATPDEFANDDALFDAVVANILARPLVLLAPALARRVRSGGRIALSGILATQSAEVAEAYAPWFRIAVGEAEDGWVALAGTRLRSPS